MMPSLFKKMSRRQTLRSVPRNGVPARQYGASMIEVLVAILLVSVGLLGIAGLSGATFSYNKVSQMRLTGIALVNDLADRARVNVYGYDLGAYNVAIGNDFVEGSPVEVDPLNLAKDPKNAADALDLAGDLAAADVDQFLRNVRQSLPQGDAVVASNATATSRDLDVWLLWKEPTTDEGDVDSDKGGFSLFDAASGNCPNTLSDDEKKEYSCMYFKVGL